MYQRWALQLSALEDLYSTGEGLWEIQFHPKLKNIEDILPCGKNLTKACALRHCTLYTLETHSSGSMV